MASVALQSEDHRHLLDIIDKLRSQGISRYVDLPEIIVCGDQSAGKSSVLEAISGMSFPTKDNLCTRFPTELVLRRGEVTAPRVSINPGPGRSEEERERLRSFHATMDPEDRWSLSNIVEDAKAAMLLSDSKEFSTDTLRIELSGPQQPHLTMVDLPGLFRAGNRDQSVANSKTVRKMVRGYMKRPRSIILAVVSAKSDAALQEVTELARDLDPTGDRTLGLITKPDCLDEGSEMQASFMSLAKNENVVFRLGWHVLKNRSYEMRNASLFERDEAEEEFFSKGIWAGLERKYVGVASLKPRLSNVLKEQILRQLPSLLRDIEAGIQDCQHGLQRLGTPRITAAEQRRYLLQVSQQFSALMSGAVEGVYNAPFFGSSKTDEGYRKRLRAVVQNTLSDFSERVRKEGRSLTIIESDEEDGYLGPSNAVSRDNYLDQVKRMMRRNRGCELPGTFNPLIVGELFTEQCRPWRGLAQAVSEDIFEAVYQTIQAILDHVAVPEVAEGILVIINSAIDKLKANCKHKLTELLTPHESGHPITYNHYLTDQVQKVQSERRKKASEKKFMEHLGSHVFSNNDFGSWKSEFPTNSLVNLLDALADSTEADMERQAASLAVDYMQAYYKVSWETRPLPGFYLTKFCITANKLAGCPKSVRRRRCCSYNRTKSHQEAPFGLQS